MVRRLLWGALIGLLGACGAASPPALAPAAAAPTVPALTKDAPGQPEVAKPVAVSLEVEARRRGRSDVEVVKPGAALRSGDEMALEVQVDRPAYVYVMYAGPDGAPARLFPKADGERLEPGYATRVPSLGRWLKLDNQVGWENLFVMASPEPLSDDTLQARVKAEVGTLAPPPPVVRVHHRRRRQAAAGGDAPGMLGADSRGMTEVEGDGVVSLPDAAGVARVRFTIQHK